MSIYMTVLENKYHKIQQCGQRIQAAKNKIFFP